MNTKHVWVWVLIVSCLSAGGLVAQQADSNSATSAHNLPAASQPVPRLIMFSGTVKDLTGKPLTGPVELSFAIYKEQTDAAPLWQESQTLNVDEQGHYTALLGAMQPEGLPVDLFTSGEARWLGVSAGKLPEQPRVLLVSVPYALKAGDAETLGGKPASAYALAQPPLGPLLGKEGSGVVDRLPGGLATPGKPKSGPKPNTTGTGTQYYIPLWTDGQGTLGNSVMYQNGSNMGIGTTTPAYRLDVVGGSARVTNPSGTTQLQVSGSATSGRLGQDVNGFFFSSDTNGAALRFLTNNGGLNEWMRITSTGNVGIGTATPAYLLDVVGGAARIANPSGVTQLQVSGSATSGRLGQDVNGFFFSSDTNGAALRFLTNNGSLNEWMRISSSGNVGIGTATPAHVLDVVGDINASTNINAGGNLAVTGTITGNGSGLTNVTAATAATANGLSCAGCVTGSEIANATITGANIASGTITNAQIVTASLLPVAIAGTAATLGSNTFVGNQTITGGLVVTANQTISGSLSLAGTLNGWTIIPSKTGSCPSLLGSGTCTSANILGGYTTGGSSGGSGVVRANSIRSGGVGRNSMQSAAVGGNTITEGVFGGTISGGGGTLTDTGGTTTSYANTVDNNWGTVAGGSLNQAGDGTGYTSDKCCQSVGGGYGNTASGFSATVAGGLLNSVSGAYAALAGGIFNTADGDDATVAGGEHNTASGYGAAVAGGWFNTASGDDATVAGGVHNTASGNYSFAAGCYANAANPGAFVWSGYTGCYSPGVPVVSSTSSGQFIALAPGGVIFYSQTDLSTGVSLAAGGGSWSSVSDRNLKEHFDPVNGENLLARLNAMPMSTWNYKAQDSHFRHLGPMAQDFYGAFGLGEDDKHIDDIDGQGVALAGVQALYRLSLNKDAEIQKQRAELGQLKAENRRLREQVRGHEGQIGALTLQVQELEKVQRQMATLEARLAQIEARTAKPQPRSIKRAALHRPVQGAAPAKPAPGSVTLAKVQF